MDNKENNVIKLGKEVKEAVVNFDIAAQLNVDKTYRNIAAISSVILVIAVFFISLATASFDWTALARAQFWIDFSITFIGAMFMKYIWGLSGNYEGNNNTKVITALEEVEQANKVVENNGLLTELEDEVALINNSNKLKDLRKRTFLWLSWFPKSERLKLRKKGIILYEEYLKTKDIQRKEAITNELNELGWNLESFKTKVVELKVEHLQMGFANGGTTASEQYSYNFMYQIFGKQLWANIISMVFTALIAVVSLVSNEVTLATVSLFATRVFVYAINGFFGYTIAKNAVETLRYTVLKNISRFLKTFVEKMKEAK